MALINKMLVIDGDNLVHRSFHGNKSDLQFNGLRTNAIVTFFSTLSKYLNTPGYTHLFIAWDIKTSETWRYKLLQGLRGDDDLDYKGGRNIGLTQEQQERRDSIREQKRWVKRLCLNLGIFQYTSTLAQGNEADDLMGAVATHCSQNLKMPVDVVTSDKDMYQLLMLKGVNIINPNFGVVGLNNVEKVFGVPAKFIVEYLCLAGDSIDAVSGIRGCGHKTALSSLAEYGSLENIVKNKEHIKGAFGKSLREGTHLPAKVLRQLITLKCDSMQDIEVERMVPFERINKKRLQYLKDELGITRPLISKVGL